MSAPYASAIEVVQAALHRVGEATIASLNDGSAPSNIAASNYEGVVCDYLTRHAWTFATKTVDLTLVGDSTAKPWLFEFAWPADVINIRVVKRCGRALETGEFDLQNNRILAMTDDALQAVVTFRAAEGKWPADFSEGIVVRMESVFLEGLVDRWKDARMKEKDAEAKILRADVRDRRQRPAVRAERTKLADIWRGRRDTGS